MSSLCETGITQLHIQKVLQDHFQTKNELQNIESEIIGKKMGYLSIIIRMKLTWKS